MRRRKFNRRNSSGHEQYKTYEHSVGNRLLNRILKIIAYIIILAGIMKCSEDMSKTLQESQGIENNKKEV